MKYSKFKTESFKESIIPTRGESIESKVRRIVEEKEPIKDGAPIIFTERKDGVLAAYNPRTDRFEIAIEAVEKIRKADVARKKDVGKKEEPAAKGTEVQGTETA